MSLKEQVEEYLEYLCVIKSMSSETIRNYRTDLQRYLDFHSQQGIEGIPDLKDVRNFLANLSRDGLKESTVNRLFSCVRGFYQHLYKDQVIDHNPFDMVKGLKIPKRLPGYLFPKELNGYLGMDGDDFTSIRDRALLECFYSTGCRVGEIAGIELENLSLQRGVCKVTGKGSKERVVFLGQACRKALDCYLPLRNIRVKDQHSIVFISRKGLPLSTRGIRYIIEGYSKKSGIQKKVSPHTFRHTFATHLVEEGADIRVVQEMLGHSSISTTGVYTHGNLDRLRGVYENAHPRSRRK